MDWRSSDAVSSEPSGRWLAVVGAVVFTGAAFLLSSMGGAAIFASPVSLPLMYLLARVHPTRPFRLAGMVVGGLTAMQVGWAVGYLFGGELRDGAVVVGAAAALVTVLVFAHVPGASPDRM